MIHDVTCKYIGHHGTYTDYLYGCRCPEARVENNRRGQWRKLHPTPRVRSLGLARRLRSLSRTGWSIRRLSVELGIGTSTISELLHHERTMVNDATAARVLARYDELAAMPGPSRRAELAAIASGWAHPDEWIGVDIDDPAASPAPCPEVLDEVVVERLLSGLMRVEQSPDPERLAAVDKLFASGLGEKRICTELRMSQDQVRRDLYRLRRIGGESRAEARIVARRAG